MKIKETLIIAGLLGMPSLGFTQSITINNPGTLIAPDASTEALLAKGRAAYQKPPGARNYKEALSSFTKAENLGSTEAEAWLGIMYLRGNGVPQNNTQAGNLITKAALANNPIGLRFMGILYQSGVVYPQNYETARAYYLKAIALNDANSFGRLGLMYLQGLGVSQDKFSALKLFVQGANGGDAWSAVHAALTYENSIAASKAPALSSATTKPSSTSFPNYPLAFLYYQKAASLGSVFAEYHLGVSYELGRGTQQDYSRALTTYRDASNSGFLPARLALARLYEVGLGAPKNLARAYALYMTAENQGSLAADQHLQQLTGQMTQDERDQGEVLTKTFIARSQSTRTASPSQ